MRNIAKINEKDRIALFKNTAANMGMPAAIIEKDFWVCWMLDFLFHNSEWKDSIAFKGGTSLSKTYGLIERFSEDIDIVLDWRVLGYDKDEPWASRSVTGQDTFNKDANSRTEMFLRESFLPSIEKAVKQELNFDIDFRIDEDDPQTVVFAYKHSFEDNSILPVIRLEIGALAAWTPTEQREISPYCAQQYGKLFLQPCTFVLTVKPERTFWEKATILHREANRTNGNLPVRYSRHYYDLYRLSNSFVKEQALQNRELLQRVVDFKDKFYHCGWAKYSDCLNGYFKLVPSEDILVKVAADYEKMQNMLFGNKPSMEEIINGLKELEKEINENFGK